MECGAGISLTLTLTL